MTASNDRSMFSSSIEIDVPRAVIPYSVKLQIDLMNPIEKVLGDTYQQMIREPHGCFEQVNEQIEICKYCRFLFHTHQSLHYHGS